MKKRVVKIEEAIGLPLSHDLTMIDVERDFKGPRFRRGHVVTAGDLDELRAMGREHLTVLELDADDVHEETAALELARLLAGDDLSVGSPSEGKCELTSRHDGLLDYNPAIIDLINDDDRWCVALRRPLTPLRGGEPVGALRILPLAMERSAVDRALAAARPLRVLPLRAFEVGLVTTGRELQSGLVKDAFRSRLEERLALWGAQVVEQTFPGDDPNAIAADLARLADGGCGLVIATGGMSVDADDVTPLALERSADRVAFRGLPVLPGCNLMVALRGEAILVGVPAGSLYVPFGSLDFLLPCFLAGRVPSREETRRWGVGGYTGFDGRFPGGGFGRG